MGRESAEMVGCCTENNSNIFFIKIMKEMGPRKSASQWEGKGPKCFFFHKNYDFAFSNLEEINGGENNFFIRSHLLLAKIGT
jgi:hypothetical protein